MADSLVLKSFENSEVNKESCAGKCMELQIHKMQVAINFLAVVTNEDVGRESGKY